MAGEFTPPLSLPLDCIDLTPGSTSIGIACEACPLVTTDIGCAALRAGEVIVTQRAEAVRRDEVNAELLERLFNIRLDALVGTAFTPEGLRDHITYDEEMQEELRQGKWGVLRLDGRFVNYINKFGSEVGDEFLQSGGEEITAIADGLVRVHPRRYLSVPAQEKRAGLDRRGVPMIYDIICRQGGDEFALLIRNVDPATLALVAARVRNQLTVSQALDRYSNGQVPFIASVGYAHASAQELTQRVTGHLAQGEYWEAFRRVSAHADEGQRRSKASQYEEMWELTVSSMPNPPVTITRPGDRETAELFLQTMCPDFMRNPIPYLTHQPENPQP